MSSVLPAPADDTLLAKVAGQQAQIRWLELRVKDLGTQLYGGKSERRGPQDQNNLEWMELLSDVQALAPVQPTELTTKSVIPKGPKPLDSSLPRETIRLPDPELKDLICLVTKRAMQPAFVETLEVLARRPAVYYVQHHERTVFTGPEKPRQSIRRGPQRYCRAPGCTPASSRTSRPPIFARISPIMPFRA